MNRWHEKSSASGRRWIATATLGLGLAVALALMPGNANAAKKKTKKTKTPVTSPVVSVPTPAPTTSVKAPTPLVTGSPILITNCGTTLSTSGGFYQVANALVSSQGLTKNGDCIDIAATNIALDVHAFSITGNTPAASKGVGIRILSSATNAIVEGANSFIERWNYGVEDDANQSTGEDLNLNDNFTGLYVNGATLSQFTNLALQSNVYGAHYVATNQCGLGDLAATQNGLYGIWIDHSNLTRVWNMNSIENTAANAWFGCGSNGSVGICPNGSKGTNNKLYDSDTGMNNEIDNQALSGDSNIGVMIEKSESGDIVTEVDSFGNSIDFTNGGTDTFCNQNTYFLTNGNLASPPCMMPPPF